MSDTPTALAELRSLREACEGEGSPPAAAQLRVQPIAARAQTADLLGSVGELMLVVDDYENGPGSKSERLMEFCMRWPSEMADFRRRAYRHVGLYPAPVNGSVAKGLKSGYFSTRLRDGSRGYPQRRVDDCLQAAIASCPQVSPHLVPDLQIGAQVAAGKDPDEVERAARERMSRWSDKHGVTVTYHASPSTSARRWISVVTSTQGIYSDRCLLMSGRDCLFDPRDPAPTPARIRPRPTLTPQTLTTESPSTGDDMASSLGSRERSAAGTSIELAGKRVALTSEGIEQSEHGEVGKKIVEAVRTAVERATEG